MLVTPSKLLGKYADIVIAVPAVNEITAPFVNAAAIQPFACELAGKQGKDPDTPRLLNKITVTI
ncbi:Hypothetical protein DEACI_3305 [Acididesulfobacillus acetoxydans]|uniref:CoA-transferase family III domain n=1 Tax=Acididesulfobacillus acetoxydans TaxID=1561005 RepID=A0A8S0XCM1_9FIRM|nr:hypothetical protein [Acididesulfobacillus acetoxydans]CAA7602626.1 Hypothetical protein DEACI_3305 [Acididesulfobacillus acetoxydans]CEJ09177.1 CoA-transferase family III domain [Acididesulfobacillus acetoxydans]